MFASAPHGSPRSNSSAARDAHQVGRLDVDVRARDRELHALVLADRPVEHDALVRVARRALDEPAAVADALGGDQNPLGVQAVEQIAEALAFLADQRRRPALRDRRRTARSSRGSSSCGSAGSSGRGRPPRADRRAGPTARRCASSPARSASCGRPAAADRSARRARSRPSGRGRRSVSPLRIGRRLQLRRVGAGRRLGDAEGLQPQLAAGDLRQELALLRVGAVPQQRAHRVHLRVARAGVAAAAVDLLEDDRRLGDAEARAAVLLGNQRREVAGVGQRLDERVGIRARGVELAPVAVGKRLAQVADAAAQILMEFDARHGVMIDHVVYHIRG